MPVEIGIWRIDVPAQRLTPRSLDAEDRLERLLYSGVNLFDEDLLILGRQVHTDFGQRIDLLGLDVEGNLVVLELKRGRSPRDAVAQLLDYGSWVRELSRDQVAQIFEDNEGNKPSLEEAFDDVFGGSPPDALNESHRLVLVASGLDPATERILQYLSEDFSVPVNAVFFQYFKDDEHEYLTRTWFRDPREVEPAAVGKGKTETWNKKDFYVSVGEGPHRNWDDMRKYGFVSGGGGKWYSRTLSLLFPSGRIFACIPGTGYVGVGTVASESAPITDVVFDSEEGEGTLLELPVEAPRMGEHQDDPDNIEHVVKVDWLHTLSREEAVWEKGMFANQNTVCRLRNKFTLQHLYDRFGVEE